MPYPPTVPPATRADATPQAGDHAADHNALSEALAAIIAELGPDPSAEFSDVSARIGGLGAAVADAMLLEDLDEQTAALIGVASDLRNALDARYAQAGGAIGTGSIADNAVTEPKLAANAVSARALATDAVDADAIANGAVGTTELADQAVTSAKVASALKDPAAADPGLRSLGTSSTSAAAGNDSRITGAAQKEQNLADLTSTFLARGNLGLGNSATRAVGITTGTVAAGDDTRLNNNAKSVGGAQEKVAALSATSGTATGDLSAASVFTVTPTGNIVIAFSNIPTGVAVTITVIVTQGATARTITYPSGTVWMGATAGPTQAANKRTIVTLITVDGGATWLATAAVQG